MNNTDFGKGQPVGNTGLNSTALEGLTYCVDWFQGTFDTKYLENIKSLIKTLFGDYSFTPRSFGIRFFCESSLHPSGVIVASGRRLVGGDVDKTLSYLELSATVLRTISDESLHRLFSYLLSETNFKPTRIDLTIDDFDRKLNIRTIKRQADKSNYLGFRGTSRFIESGRKGCDGLSISFGNRGSNGSGKRVVIYDKGIESNKVIDSIRIEVSFYQKYSIESFNDLANSSYQDWGFIIKSWISGSIDFVNKSVNSKNTKRCKRFKWWDRIVGDSVKLKPISVYEVSSVKKIKNWFSSQIAPSLAILVQSLTKDESGEFWDFFYSLINDGYSRFTDKHRFIVQNHLLLHKLPNLNMLNL